MLLVFLYATIYTLHMNDSVQMNSREKPGEGLKGYHLSTTRKNQPKDKEECLPRACYINEQRERQYYYCYYLRI